MRLAAGPRFDRNARAARPAVLVDATLRQFLVMLPFFAVCGLMPSIGLAIVARPLFMAGAVALCYIYWRRSPWLFITATLWFWTFTPLIRRLIDFHSGFNATDPILATPNLVMAFMLIDVLQNRRLFSHAAAQLGLLVLVPMLWGLMVSLVDGQIVAGAVGSMDWIMPLLYYFYIIAHADRIGEVEGCLQVFLALNGLLVVTYGLFQAFWLPDWDMAWLVSSGLDTSKRFDQGGFRVFGSLNSAQITAFWLSALMTLTLHFRTVLSVIIVPAAFTLLLLTGVRSVFGVTLALVLLAALIGQHKVLPALLAASVALVMTAAVLSVLNPALTDRLTSRFTQVDLASDDSALARRDIVQNSPAIVSRYPLGLGVGALGRGAVLSSDMDLVSVDFGPLATYLSLGWVAGTMYLVGLCVVVGNALAVAGSRRSSVGLLFGLVAAGLVAQLAITNIIGFAGMILWISAGFAVTHVPGAATARI